MIPICLKAQDNKLIYKQYSDKYNESYIILKSNDRFIAELYFDDDEGGGYSGFWWISKDTLFLLSDNIECDLYDLMKIRKAELVKFRFIVKDSLLLFSQLEKYQQNKYINIDFNDKIETRFFEKKDVNMLNIMRQTFISDSTKILNLTNSFWKSIDNKIFIKILEDYSIEYYDMSCMIKRYGYLVDNSPSSLDFKIILDNIIIKNYENVSNINNVRYDKISLRYYNSNFIINNYEFVKCIIGDESDYIDWYNFDNSAYLDAINSKIDKIKAVLGTKMIKINEDTFKKLLLEYYFQKN